VHWEPYPASPVTSSLIRMHCKAIVCGVWRLATYGVFECGILYWPFGPCGGADVQLIEMWRGMPGFWACGRYEFYVNITFQTSVYSNLAPVFLITDPWLWASGDFGR
jgi:hypothetical protein